jgi:hypothetical protein
MTNNEHLEIAKIIERKILNDNIIITEEYAYNDLPYIDKLLSITDRKNLLGSIMFAIKNNKDLNKLLGKDMTRYVLTDLNDYYKMVKNARETSVDSYLKKLELSDFNNDTINYINYFLETHSYIENIVMKKYILKNIGKKNIDNLSNDDIDKIFYEYMKNYPVSITSSRMK